MQTTVTFKNLEPSDNLKEYVTSKLNRFDKLLDNPAEAHVVLSVEKIRHIAEIRLNGDRLNLVCREQSNDMYSSIDLALDKLEKQIKKHKEKIRSRHQGARDASRANRNRTAGFDEFESGDEIIEETIEYKPMDVEEAVMQMDIERRGFFVFINARTNRVNVLYKKRNGRLAIIQPAD